MPPELTPWLAALAFLLGILALVLEIFLFGFGIAGVAGIIFIGWGIFLLSVDVTLTFKSLVIALAVTIILFILGIKLMSRLNLWQRFTLGDRQAREAGYNAPRTDLGELVGRQGITLTPLRPAGAAEVNGERMDVVSEGGYVAAREKVVVVKVEGARVVVRRL